MLRSCGAAWDRAGNSDGDPSAERRSDRCASRRVVWRDDRKSAKAPIPWSSRISAARAAMRGITVLSNSSARMARNCDCVVTTETIIVALTSTMASQNDRKILRNRLFKRSSPDCAQSGGFATT